MAQLERDTTPEATGWYIITADRVTVVRVHSGMTIGENESGKLSFESAHAQLILEIESSSSLVVRALGNIRLTSSEADSEPTDHISCNRSVAISLAQNTLQLNTEFVSFKPSKRPLRLRVVYPSADSPDSVPEAESAPHHDPVNPEIPADVAAPLSLPDSSMAESTLLDQMKILITNVKVRALSTRISLGIVGVAVAFLTLTLVLGFLIFDSDTTPKLLTETETVEAQQAATPSVNESSRATPAQGSEAQAETPLPATDSARPVVDSVVAVDSVSEPLDAGSAALVADEVEVAGTDAAEPSEQLPREPGFVPEAEAEAEAKAEPEPEPQPVAAPTPEPSVEVPVASAKTEPTTTANAERARAAKIAQQRRARAQALKRDLEAADAALADGRLLVPEDTGALALYHRILSDNPESPEALRGMASVREQLINRAFAQLASGEWRSAAATLDAAEKAGASGDLVADLRSEASYQLRLARAQAGQFDDLYPSELLDAIEQNTPRVSRRQAGGIRQVEVEFTVTMRGNVRDIQTLGNPPPRLADRIERAVENWRFEPVLENGRPLPVRTRVLIDIGS